MFVPLDLIDRFMYYKYGKRHDASCLFKHVTENVLFTYANNGYNIFSLNDILRAIIPI
jgi:hypothetical protein